MRIQLSLFLMLFPLVAHAADAQQVRTHRVPNAGVQPQAVVDDKGVAHLVYLAGDPGKADIFYIRSSDGGDTFTNPIRVNSGSGSAMAIGTVRGAQLALGKAGRVHVAWMGSPVATPKAAGNATPMLYTHSTEDGLGFEPERNVIQSHPGLDGGGSIAADERGNVYVAWHAPAKQGTGEDTRQVWLTQSHDGGASFAAEESISSQESGACGCCGLRILASGGAIYTLYRTADQKIERDMTLLRLDPKDNRTVVATVGKTRSAICVMSTSALAASSKSGVVGAWETNGQIFWSPFPSQGALSTPILASSPDAGHKHPSVAINSAGQILVVWTEGTGWNKGGSIAWRGYDSAGKPIAELRGRADGLLAWGSPAAFARGDGSFVVMY